MTDKIYPVINIDFDGVIHSYEKGWQNGEIYGTVTPGFFEWAAEAKKHFTLHIYSSRSDSHKGIKPMQDWLTMELQAWQWDREEKGEARADLTKDDFDFPTHKGAAFLTIDDRALTFKGDWGEFAPDKLREFKSWVQK